MSKTKANQSKEIKNEVAFTEEVINPNLVDHLNHPWAKTIRSLLTREGREADKKIIIDDEENIVQAIKSKVKVHKIFTTDRERLTKEFLNQLPTADLVADLSKRTGKKLFGNEKISRVFAIAEMPKPYSLEALGKIDKDFIALDGLTISGNIGAIIRTSAALEIGALVLLDSNIADTYDRRVIRASRGYVFSIPILHISTTDLIKFCHQNDFKLLVTALHSEVTIEEASQDESKLAIVFGSEKEGCSQELLNAAQIRATIPINRDVESLNVSAAASIILYLRNLRARSYKISQC